MCREINFIIKLSFDFVQNCASPATLIVQEIVLQLTILIIHVILDILQVLHTFIIRFSALCWVTVLHQVTAGMYLSRQQNMYYNCTYYFSYVSLISDKALLITVAEIRRTFPCVIDQLHVWSCRCIIPFNCLTTRKSDDLPLKHRLLASVLINACSALGLGD